MKKKLNLNELKVESFVTTHDINNAETIKGGRPPAKSYNGNCLPAEPDYPVDRITDNFCSLDFVCNTGHLCYISINATC